MANENEVGELSERERQVILARRKNALSPEKLAEKDAVVAEVWRIDGMQSDLARQQAAEYAALKADGATTLAQLASMRERHLDEYNQLQEKAEVAQRAFRAFKRNNREPDDLGPSPQDARIPKFGTFIQDEKGNWKKATVNKDPMTPQERARRERRRQQAREANPGLLDA